MSEVSREEMREMRDTGRRAMEKVADVARQAAAQSGISRTFARVSKVNGDGTLQLELGSEAHPMPLYAVRSTTACAAAQPGDTVVVDTYAHVPLATGVVHTAGSADHLVPEHSQDASTIASGTINHARLPLATTSSPGAVSVGGGLKVSGGRLSVDNGAYVKLAAGAFADDNGKNGVYLFRWGPLRVIQVQFTHVAAGGTDFGHLPGGEVPRGGMEVLGYLYIQGVAGSCGQVKVGLDGKVSMWMSKASDYCSGQVVFLV